MLEIKFRHTALGFIPYIELSLKRNTGLYTQKLPLKEVMVGPSANPDLSLQSLTLYLESKGYFMTKPRRSKVPLRSWLVR